MVLHMYLAAREFELASDTDYFLLNLSYLFTRTPFVVRKIPLPFCVDPFGSYHIKIDVL